MKATLTFDLSSPEERELHRKVLRVEAMHSALWEVGEYLREQAKYHSDDTRDDAYDTRKRFFEIMSEHGITLDE
jgi:hypothetical protein